MKKLILFLFLFISLFSQAQTTYTDILKVRKQIYYKNIPWLRDSLLMNNLRIKQLLAGVDPTDGVNLQQLKDSLASLSNVRFPRILFDTTQNNLPYDYGQLYMDSTRQALTFFAGDPDVTHFVGEQLLNPLCVNNSGGNIGNLKAVYITSAAAGKLEIELADNRVYEKSRMIGITTQSIDNGEIGRVTRFGLVKGDLSAFDIGDAIYLGEDGELTNIRPNNGNFPTYIGIVVDNVIGELYVNPYLVEYTAEINKFRGWPKNTNTTIVPESATRKIKLPPTVGDTFYTYEDGVKYIHGVDSIIFSDVEGVHDIYYDGQNLVDGVNLTSAEKRTIYSNKAGVTTLYWDAVNDTIVYINDMRHFFTMAGSTWATFWDFHKCEIVDAGLSLTDLIVDAMGSLDSHAQFGNTSALIRNQDILTSVPAQSSTTGYTVFYRDGLGGNWRSQDGAPFGILTTGTGLAAWNEDVAGTWQITEATNGYFVPYILLTSNTLGDKVGTIMPSAEYATVAEAEVGAQATLGELIQGLPIQELKTVAIVIYETRINYTNAVKSRIVSTTEGDDYIDLRTSIIGGGGTGGITTSFLALTDTPSSYAGQANKYVQVNPGETGLIFSDLGLTGLRDSVANNTDSIAAHRTDINENSARIKDIENDTTNYNTAYAHSQITGLNPHNSALSQQSDVNITTPADEEVLTYDSGEWKNLPLPTAKFNFISTTQTLEKGRTYIVNNLISDIDLSLPLSPIIGDFVLMKIEDVGFITDLLGNGFNIDGAADLTVKKAWYQDVMYIVFNGTQWETLFINSDIEDLGTEASNFYDFNSLNWQYFRTKKSFSALGSVFSNPPSGFTFSAPSTYNIFIDANVSITGEIVQKVTITIQGAGAGIENQKNQIFVRSGENWTEVLSNGWHRTTMSNQSNTFDGDQVFKSNVNLTGTNSQINVESFELNKIVLQAPTTSDINATSLISYTKSDDTEIANIGFPNDFSTTFDINNKIGEVYLRNSTGLKLNTFASGVDVTGDYYKNGSLLSVNDLGDIGDYVTLGTTQTILGQKTFNTGGLNPLAVSRQGSATENINIDFAHNGGVRRLGMDSNEDLKWGASTGSDLNDLIYHSGNSNKSDVDWSCRDLTTSESATVRGILYSQSVVPQHIFVDTDKTGDGKYWRIVANGGVCNMQNSQEGDIWNSSFAFIAGGTTEFYYNGIKKLETTATGIDVTGSITLSGTVDGRDVASDGVKLDGLAQSDWDATSGGAEILNKPVVITDTVTKVGLDAAVSATGSWWTAMGNEAGYSNTTGSGWTAIGESAGYSNTTGEDWTAVGNSSGYVNESGYGWTAVGSFAGFSNILGNEWTAIGSSAGNSGETGNSWTAIGYQSGLEAAGNDWISIGKRAGAKNETGNDWISIGRSAGYWLTNGTTPAISFSNSLYIGSDTRVSANGVTNENVFGYLAIGKGSNTVAIGNSSITDNYFFGNVDITGEYKINGTSINTNGTLTNIAYTDAAETFSSTVTATNFILSSDRRLKTRIKDLLDVDWVDKVEFKKFYFKNDKSKLRYGVIAQELQKIAPELVNRDKNGKLGVSYIDLLIIKCKRQDDKIKSLEQRISKLEKLLQCAN